MSDHRDVREEFGRPDAWLSRGGFLPTAWRTSGKAEQPKEGRSRG